MVRDPRRFAWLDDRERGKSPAAIARRHHVPQRTVQHEISLAQAEVTAFIEARRLMPVPRLVLFFPINGFFPHSRCRHAEVPLPAGTTLCCAVCHRSGLDHHPALQRYPRYDARPVPAPGPHSHEAHARPTRKERRASLPDHPERAA